ncbi:hypothetical protein DZB84_18385 [Bacillus sp. HNG]|uniref:hypothetical protein n=1 Tax=Bacillus sp. HNG TaxID=2293325 RepID=UPI000E2E7608|nr:hypothetical protein [Bacillus sp. HNG]RFB12719.1 hypothetical protein DZB84_18385 [Bacillus sp. HNG]
MKYEYEDRAIAFLDFLGFRNIVSKTIVSANERINLLSTLQNIANSLTVNPSQEEEEEFFRKYEESSGSKLDDPEDIMRNHPMLNDPKFIETVNYFGDDEDTDLSTIDRKVTIFSDSIIISYPIDRMYALLFEIQHVAQVLSTCGYMVRGGITFGKLYHSESIVVGPAMIEAYDLESSEADTPRIILNKEYLNKASEYNDQYKLYVDFMKSIKLDEDGYNFIDFTVLAAPGSFNILGERINKDLEEIAIKLEDSGNSAESIKKLNNLKEKNEWAKRLIEPLLT